MKLAMVIHNIGYPFATGGAELFSLRFALALAALGAKVLLLQEGPASHDLVLQHGGIHLIYVPYSKLRHWTLNPIVYARVLSSWKPDVVIGVSRFSIHPLTAYRMLTGRGYIVRFAGLDICLDYLVAGYEPLPGTPSEYCSAAKKYLKSLLKKFAIITGMRMFSRCVENGECAAVTLSNTMRVLYEAVYPGKPFVIPNFVDDEFYRIGVKRLKLWERVWKGRRIVYLGRLEYQKGADILAAASEIILSECNDCQVIIIGDGPYRDLFERIREKYAGRIVLKGFVSYTKVPRALQEADIFVFPTRIEGSPNALLQAMAAALPIVASRIPPNIEFLGDAGLYSQPEDPVSIAKNVLQLVTDETRARRLAEKAYKRSQEYRIENVLMKYLKAIEQLYAR